MFRTFAKALRAMRFSGAQRFFGFMLPRTKFDYKREVGTGLDSSVVSAPVGWIQRAFIEAPLTVVRERAGENEVVEDHALAELIRRPNPFHDETNLWSATLLSYFLDGNAYWLKVRNRGRQVAELWWAPWWQIEPMWAVDGSEFIGWYEFRPGTG
ncbi:MAG: phage portal protein, partial [Gammaproteobacteria bacterium]